MLLVLGYAGYDLYRLQANFESPSEDVVLKADEALSDLSSPKPIDSYEVLEIPVVDDVSVTVHYLERPDATANVLMVHGAGGGAWVWEYFFELLPEEYNLYAISWRGHFTSSPVADANSQDYVQDQAAVIDAITERNDLPLHILAHSYGGATSVMLGSQGPEEISSLHLVAPVVPVEFTFLQRQLVPPIVGRIIENSADSPESGPFKGMFVSQTQMAHYFETHASQPYSVEKPGLIARDGLSQTWYDELDSAYQAIGDSELPVWMFIARYDNVVVPEQQKLTADSIGANWSELESGHYIQLDVQLVEVVNTITNNLASLNN